ncbi:MAG: porin family protein [Gammaproteobacteria bacterium]|nr:porin family protein [Gammaproteobacteria bacterium]
MKKHLMMGALLAYLTSTSLLGADEFKGHWYLEPGLGGSDFDGDVRSFETTTGIQASNFDTTDDGGIFRLTGGYRFNRNFALEGGITSFDSEFERRVLLTGPPTSPGVVTIRGLEARVDIPTAILASPIDSAELTTSLVGFTLAAVGIIPLGERFAIFGRAGLLNWYEDVEVTTGALGAELDDDESATDPFFGVGFRYQINPMIGVGLDVEHYDLGGTDVDVANVMVRINFGQSERD